MRRISPTPRTRITKTAGGRVNRRFAILAGVLAVAGIAGDVSALRRRAAAGIEFQEQVELAKAQAAEFRARVVVPTESRVPAGENFAGALQRVGLSAAEAADATAAAQQAFNLRQLRAGNSLTVGRSVEGSLKEIDYKIDADRM